MVGPQRLIVGPVPQCSYATAQVFRSRQPPLNGSTTVQGKAIETQRLNQPGTPTLKGGPAGCSIELQQGVLIGRSVYLLTTAQYIGEKTMACMDA